MAAFKYKFKTLKEIKQRLEKKTQKELALIDLDIKKKQIEIVEIRKLLKVAKENKIEEKLKSSIELNFFEKYECYLNEQISIIETYILRKMNQRKEKLKELMKKSKETKIFEKLEEKHLLDFLETENRNEQKEMDEIAIQEYLKG